ncbi:MAG TPA: type II toxin-antitoxin system VapC family toxin [Thermomicrobiales bacterium]|nr:type II toxin-antitoxin system VapC family toxin [Thermomicrobiales bacterium]
MIVIDTSAWIAGLMRGDAHHAGTVPFLRLMESRSTQNYVPAHFLAEIAGVLARTGERGEIIEREIGSIEKSGRFHIAPVSVGLGLLAAEIARVAKIRGADAVFVALARGLDFPLITWDRQQRERGSVFCRTMTPVEAMDL